MGTFPLAQSSMAWGGSVCFPVGVWLLELLKQFELNNTLDLQVHLFFFL
jgi:hypothetical protein